MRDRMGETSGNSKRICSEICLQVTVDNLSFEPNFLSKVAGFRLQICANDFDLGLAGSQFSLLPAREQRP